MREASEHSNMAWESSFKTYYLKRIFPQDSALPTKCLTVLQ